MTTLEIFYTALAWLCYGCFNASQYKWYRESENPGADTFMNIVFAPIALIIRIIRGVFFWKGQW